MCEFLNMFKLNNYFFLSVDDLLSNQDVFKLTCAFFFLNFFAATQDRILKIFYEGFKTFLFGNKPNGL